MNSVHAKCLRPVSDFEKEKYIIADHMFANSIIMPNKLFTKLNLEPFSYVRVKYDYDDDGKLLYAIPFKQGYDPEEDVVAISTNLMVDINSQLGVTDDVIIESVENPSSPSLEVYRPYSDGKNGVCYLNDDILDSIGVKKGEEVEIYNTKNGGRITLKCEKLFSNDSNKNKIRLDLHTKQILNVEIGDSVRVRKPMKNGPSETIPIAKSYNSIMDRMLEFFVGSRKVSLRTKTGLDQDENRGIVRMNTSTMKYLGINEKDTINIKWKNQQITVQCFPAPSDIEIDALELLLPSSVRDQIGLNPHDGIQWWRNKRYKLQKQISVSILGILGVIVGTFTVANSTRISVQLLDWYGTLNTVVILLIISGVISIPVIWFLLLPVRNEVRN